MRRQKSKEKTATCTGQETKKKELKNQKQMSLRQISQHLFELGYVNKRGKPYKAKSVKGMVHCFGVVS